MSLPIFVDNDANAAVWAEHRFGAGRGESHLVMVNLGTGIGGGIVLDGRVIRGRFGIAGEFGHMQVVPDGIRCECGNRGCWEQYASGNALVREARALISAGSPVVSDLFDRVGGRPEDLTGPLVTEAARDGDPLARELLSEIGRWLGIGMADLAAALDPGTFVIGGGVSAAGDLLLDPAREAFRRQLTGRGYRPEAAIVAGPARQRGRARRRGRPRPHRRRRRLSRRPCRLVRVASYNTRDFLDDHHLAARVVRAVDPDVLCLQEVPRRLFGGWRVARFAAACGLQLAGPAPGERRHDGASPPTGCGSSGPSTCGCRCAGPTAPGGTPSCAWRCRVAAS